jgi:sensor domain CHASE-containing protein/signal transduction histidine kinase
MKLGSKVGLGILGITSVVLCVFVLFQRPMMLKSFMKLQSAAAELNAERAYKSILTEVSALGRQTQDWGSWDDTYDFVLDSNPNYRRVNLSDSTFETTHVDLIWIMSNTQLIRYAGWRDLNGVIHRGDPGVNLVDFAFPANLRGKPRNKGAWDIRTVGQQPMVLYARPVLDSSEKKQPVGMIVIGRFLDRKKVDNLASAIGVVFSLEDLSGLKRQLGQLPVPPLQGTFSYNSPPTVQSDVISIRNVTGDDGETRFGIICRTGPTILIDGVGTVNNSIGYMICFSLFSSLLGLILIKIMVTRPLATLSAEVSDIGKGNSRLVSPSLTERNDEIGLVSRFFQTAFDQLEVAQISLVKASHEAGMASVAREVLHNAGNVFNSIRVAIGQLHSIAANSKILRLQESVALLNENKEDLDRYTKEDPKGSKVLPFLTALSDRLVDDHKHSLSELDDLSGSVAHMGEVILAQYTFASPMSQQEEVFLAPIVEESARIVQKSLQHHGVNLELSLEPEVKASCFPPLLIRVLVNLLTNAKDAVQCREAGDRTIKMQLKRLPQGGVSLLVQDNGEGVEVHDATRIFSNGFTTKPNGSGYGLHYCANTLREMGWSIRMESAGPGTGASFVLLDRTESLEKEAA